MGNLPDVYEQLFSIQGINFTAREIDVIACILHGRVTKKIAIILAISYKTVGTHISKIMSKVGCRSQEGIIDFIEGSDKYNFLRQHYINLLVKYCFKQELNNINNVISTQNIACLIVMHAGQGENEKGFNEFCEYLKLAGIVSTIKTDADPQLNSCVDYVLHCYLSKDTDPPNIVTTEANAQHVLVVCFGQPAVEDSSTLHNVDNINLRDYDNLYFFIFVILKKLLPNFNIDSNIINFKKLYAIHVNSDNEIRTQKPKHSSNEPKMTITSRLTFWFIFNFKRLLKLKNKNFWIASCLLAMAMITGGICFNHRGSYHKSSPVVWNLPRQDHDFIGRRELLNKLETRLHPKNLHISTNNRISVISVCAGLGGVGKTQLALHYIHNSKRNYSLKAWFFAENIDQLKRQYIDLAGVLGYRAMEPSFEKAQHYVKEWLSKHPGWLLVYDNVNSYNEIKDFLPSDGGGVILTSRQQKWPNTFAKLDVEVMPKQEAMQLIESLLQRKTIVGEQESVEKLVVELGCLPLALAQAGAYIKQNGMTIAEYLKFYKKYELELLSDNTLPEGVYTLPIAATWSVSLDAIVKEARDDRQQAWALHLLNVCAYLAPEKIPESLLLTWFKIANPQIPNVELTFAKLIGQLRRYSMISKDDGSKISVHRLVQSVVRYQQRQTLEKKSYYSSLTQQWFDSLLHSANVEFIKKTTSSEDEARQKQLLPHMQSLSYHYQKLWPKSNVLHLALNLHNIGDALQLIGENALSRSYYEKALSILELDYNKNYAEITTTLDQLGTIYRELGNLNQAKILHERSLKIKEKHYAKDHVAIAHTLDHLGRDYRILGDAKQAQILHERALNIKENFYVKDHIEIAKTLDYLGRDCIKLFNITKAKVLHEKSLRIKEKYYGNNHFEVAATLDYLGRSYRVTGDIQHAIGLHERSVKSKEDYFGKYHTEVDVTLVQLGLDYSALGDLSRAKKIHERALKINEQCYGRDHVAVAYVIDHLGRDYRNLGNVAKAKMLHVEALRIKEIFYDKDSIPISLILEQLAHDQVMLGETKQAMQLYQRVLQIQQRYYGDSHDLTLKTKQAIMVLSSTGN